MLSNPEKGPIMSRQLLMKECKSTRDKLIERLDGVLTDLMDLQMAMVYKLLVEVHIKQ